MKRTITALMLAALPLACAQPATAQSSWPTRAARVNAGGTVILTCNASDEACRPVGPSNPLPVSGGTGGGVQQVEGAVADGAADSGNSVKTGAIYSSAAPLPAMNSGARVPLQADTYGSLRVTPVPAGQVTPSDGGTTVQSQYGRANNTPSVVAIPLPQLGYVWTGSALAMQRGDASGSYVIGKGGAGIASAQTSVGTAATLVAAARTGRQKILLTVSAANACAFGPAGVTTSTGFRLQPTAGASITLDTAAAVYAACSATTTIDSLELF